MKIVAMKINKCGSFFRSPEHLVKCTSTVLIFAIDMLSDAILEDAVTTHSVLLFGVFIEYNIISRNLLSDYDEAVIITYYNYGPKSLLQASKSSSKLYMNYQ